MCAIFRGRHQPGAKEAFNNELQKTWKGSVLNFKEKDALYDQAIQFIAAREQYATSAEWHHLMTVENNTSTAAGGPYTPLFEALAEKRGWESLDVPENQVLLVGHQGPHPEYNQLVYEIMQNATDGLVGAAHNRAFDAALASIAVQTVTPGTELNRLATGGVIFYDS